MPRWKKNKKTKKVKFPPKESKRLNQHKVGDLYPNLAANIVVDYLVENELGIGDASSLFYTAQLIEALPVPVNV